LIFLMVVGFGYSYFWSESTIIYLLMRRKVDDTDLDEVYLEEEETEDAYSHPITTSTTVPAPAATEGVSMVESPTLRPSASTGKPAPVGEGMAAEAVTQVPPAPSATESARQEGESPGSGDGNPPAPA